jgi:hypothetical protein
MRRCNGVGSAVRQLKLSQGWNMMIRSAPFHARATGTLTLSAVLLLSALPAHAAPPANNYPTFARVQYVEECMRGGTGGVMASLYQCSCAIDHIAEHLTYDQFVEASTFAHYSGLPGEGGGIFRDPDRAKQQAKLFRDLEAEAYRSCGLKPPG